MSEPTKEQKKEFWEGLGFKFTPHLSSGGRPYDRTELMEYPDGNKILVNKGESLEIDQNSLFRYAVPNRISEIAFMYAANCVSCDIEDLEGDFFEGHIDVNSIEEAWEKSALALFWAIRKVFLKK